MRTSISGGMRMSFGLMRQQIGDIAAIDKGSRALHTDIGDNGVMHPC
jgi:hypothetical protein